MKRCIGKVLMVMFMGAVPWLTLAEQSTNVTFWSYYEKYPCLQEFFPFGFYGGVAEGDVFNSEMIARANLRLSAMADNSMNAFWRGGENVYKHEAYFKGYYNYHWPVWTDYGEWLYGKALPLYGVKVLPVLTDWTTTHGNYDKSVARKPMLADFFLDDRPPNEKELLEMESRLKEVLDMAKDIARRYPESVIGFITDDEPRHYLTALAVPGIVSRYTGMPALYVDNAIGDATHQGAVSLAKVNQLATADLYPGPNPWSIARDVRIFNRECPNGILWFMPWAHSGIENPLQPPGRYGVHPHVSSGLGYCGALTRVGLRLQMWEALALGCKGVFFFSGGVGNWQGGENCVTLFDSLLQFHTDVSAEMRDFGQMLAGLGPLLLSCRPETNVTINVESGKARFPEFEGPALDYGLLRDVRNDRFFFVPWNNDIYAPQHGGYVFPKDLLAGRKIYDLAAMKPVSISNNRLEVELPPGGGRFYLIGSKKEFTDVSDRITRYGLAPLKAQVRSRYEIAQTNGVELKAAADCIEQAKADEGKGKWREARQMYEQALGAIRQAEEKVPGLIEVQKNLKSVADNLGLSEDLLRRHLDTLDFPATISRLSDAWDGGADIVKACSSNSYVGPAIGDWYNLRKKYFEAQGRYFGGQDRGKLAQDAAQLEKDAQKNAQTIQTGVNRRLAELRKLKVAFVIPDVQTAEYMGIYAWLMKYSMSSWYAPDGKGKLVDAAGKEFDPAGFDAVWIHQLRFNEPPARGRLPSVTQALMPELMQPEMIKAMREYTEKGGGILLTGIAGLYSLPLGIETNAPDRLREERYYLAERFGVGLIPASGCEKHPLFGGFPEQGFGLNGNAGLGNTVAECAWDERKPGGIVLANELDSKSGIQSSYAAVVEYRLGKGKVLVMGGKSYDFTSDNAPQGNYYNDDGKGKNDEWLKITFDQRIRQLSLNALKYLAGKESFMPGKIKEPVEKTGPKLAPSSEITVPKVKPSAGDLTKAPWLEGKTLGDWRKVTGEPTDRRIRACVMHDGVFLYLQLEDELGESKLVQTDTVWGGDVWEVFFALNRFDTPYYQWAVNAKGKTAALSHGTADRDWKCGVRYTTRRDGGRWLIQAAFPLESLAEGGLKSNDSFYANFFRQIKATGENLAWRPTFSTSFHELRFMGKLKLN